MTVFPSPFIRYAQNADIPKLKELIKYIFKDSNFFINLFFDYKFKETRTLIYQIEEQIVAFAFLLPSKMFLQEKLQPITYLYACATLPEYRNKGFMREILETAYQQACIENQLGVFLLPATDELYHYYEKSNFNTFFYRRHTKYQAENFKILNQNSLKIKIISASEYASLRLQTLKKDGTIHWDENHFKLIEKSFGVQQALFFKIIHTNSSTSMGFLTHNSTQIKVEEFLTPHVRLEENLSILLKQFPVSELEVFSPGEDKRHGLIRVNPNFASYLEGKKGYFAFGID